MSQHPSLFLSVGKQVKDEYGRPIGRIASFAVTPNGSFDSVFVERGDGRFQKHPVEQLRLDGEEITLLGKLKSEANVFCDQIPLIWRKDQALKDLNEKKKISPELYQELHNTFDTSLVRLKKEAQALEDLIDTEIGCCIDETRSLNYALVHLEIEHEIGKVDQQTYETAFTMIQESIKRINVEKGDLEITRAKLSNILLGDASGSLDPRNETAEPAETPELPEPPVVVYVKEIGRTSG